jgi:hypothetical protein
MQLHVNRRNITMLRVTVILSGLVLLLASQTALSPAEAAYGSRGSCNPTVSRATMSGAITSVSTNVLQMGCAVRSPQGSLMIRWSSTPHPSYTATGSFGKIQSVNVTWGPRLTRVYKKRMTPWEYPNILSPGYIAWALTHPRANYQAYAVVHSWTARVCTVTFAGTKMCTDGDFKATWKLHYGLRVCAIAPVSKCGAWKRLS